MVLQKIYVNQNYHEITLGSIEKFARVHSEGDGSGGKLWYIIGDEDARKFCEKHGLAGTVLSHDPVVEESPPDAGADVVHTNEEYLKTGTLPVKYYCKDCKDHHTKGEPEYYSCLDKFISDIWSSDAETAPVPLEKADVPDPGAVEAPDGDKVEDPLTGEDPPPPVPDLRTHGMNAHKSIELIDSVTDFTELNMLKEGEYKNPDFPSGRKGVLNAIHERIQSLVKGD